MKILIVNNFYTPNIVGGGEKSVQSLAEGLVKSNNEVYVVTMSLSDSQNESKLNGVNIFYLPVLGNKVSPLKEDRRLIERVFWQLSTEFNRGFISRFESLLNVIKPDVIHTNNLTGLSRSIWRLAALKNIPCVHTLRDYFLMCSRGSLFKNGKTCDTRCNSCRVLTFNRKVSSYSVKAVVGNSEFILQQHLDAGFFKDSVIQSVVFSSSAQLANNEMSDKLNKKSKDIKIGFIGRFHETKGLPVLFKALKSIPQKGWKLLVAGKGSLSGQNISHNNIDHEQVEWLGWTEPEDFFSRIDVLVVPSTWHDPLPRVIFEAYMHGIPVIASNRGGCPEIVDIGETGWVFNPDFPDELSQILLNLINEPKLFDEMRSKCLQKSKLFSQENNVASYQEVYNNIVNN